MRQPVDIPGKLHSVRLKSVHYIVERIQAEYVLQHIWQRFRQIEHRHDQDQHCKYRHIHLPQVGSFHCQEQQDERYDQYDTEHRVIQQGEYIDQPVIHHKCCECTIQNNEHHENESLENDCWKHSEIQRDITDFDH